MTLPYLRHGRPTGRAEGPPEDRLRLAIHVCFGANEDVDGGAKPHHDELQWSLR